MVRVRDSNGGRKRRRVLLTTAAAFAGAGAVTWYRSRRAERVAPPIGRFVVVDGIRVHYVERGEGPPLVMLHGDGSLLEDFTNSDLFELASRRYRVIVLDRPGSGYSERPAMEAWGARAQADLIHRVLKALNADDAVVLGHSWGALVAMALALDHPDSVRSLVLISGYYFPTPRPGFLFALALAVPGIEALFRWTFLPLLLRLLWPMLRNTLFAPEGVHPAFLRFPVDKVLRPSQLRAVVDDTVLTVPSAFVLSSQYPQLAKPAVILATEADRVVDTRQQSVRLYRHLPDSKLRLVPRGGHMIHYVMPEAVLTAVDESLQMGRSTAK